MKRPLIIHPFLFAIYPPLALFATTMKTGSSSPHEVVIPIIFMIIVTIILWFLLTRLRISKGKAALCMSIGILMIFVLGPVNSLIFTMTGHNLHNAIFVTWIALFALSIYVSQKVIKNVQDVTRVCNAIAIFLIATTIILAGFHYLRTPSAMPLIKNDKVIELNSENTGKSTILPNIYYIILDAYARADILDSLYHYDNVEFLNYLKQKDFYIANRSRANYMQTYLSLASSLNFEYLDGLVHHVGTECSNIRPLTEMIHNNRLVNLLKKKGYKFVNISSGFAPTEIRGADIYIKTGHLGEFTNVLISQTLYSLHPSLTKWLYGIHRKSVLRTFEELVNTTKLKSPIFVFSHIITPHPPFVFGENGEEKTPTYRFCLADASDFTGLSAQRRYKYRQEYKAQLIFINKRIRATIDQILSTSRTPPIIILQGDHGPGSMLDRENLNNSYIKERMAIFNAYYLPNNSNKLLYEEITPVNTFRVILNHYFSTNLHFLDDRCYFSTLSRPYKFIDVTTETAENHSGENESIPRIAGHN
jgi:hypothetical protein